MNGSAVLFIITGVGCIAAGGAVVFKAQEGLQSLQAVYRAQNIQMSYDEQGNFIDRGTVEDGNAILNLLAEDWQYPLNRKNLLRNHELYNPYSLYLYE